MSESGSLSVIDQILSGQMFMGVPDFCFGTVDVRDVATAHIRAAEMPDSHGRYILSSDRTVSFVEISRILRSITQSYFIPNHKLPNALVRLAAPLLRINQKWLRLNLGISFSIDNSPSINDLQIVYRSLDETLKDHYESWKMSQGR